MSSYSALRETVCTANAALVAHHLVILTWGNVSAIDRGLGIVAIKPSGVPYSQLTPEKVVVVDLAGAVAEGSLRPSSDVATHLELYRAFPGIGGIVHTHSPKATAFAQARRTIPCLGTTHADHFHGPVPVTRDMRHEEMQHDYEINTGKTIAERFAGMDPTHCPGVLVASHGPFTWGADAPEAVRNSVALEAIAEMAMDTYALDSDCPPVPRELLNRHFLRKHGPKAYYGQADSSAS